MEGSKQAGVALVMSLTISSSVKPTASFAAALAIGKPVAFDASAEERETRGFISMTIMRPFSGLTANCTLEPPVSTPIFSKMASEAARMRWYSTSERVCAGATVTESPVCTPMASKFSMEHTMMPLPALSRMTSISYSFQPSMLSSTSTSPAGESSRPWETMVASSSGVCAMPPPAPPSV